MNPTYFIGPILAVGLLAIITIKLLKRQLRERHAIWWAVGATIAFFLSIFPGSLETLSEKLGFEAPLNFVLIFAIAIIFLVNLQQSSELTQLEEKVRTLSEHIALIEMREQRNFEDEQPSTPDS